MEKKIDSVHFQHFSQFFFHFHDKLSIFENILMSTLCEWVKVTSESVCFAYSLKC